jgi:hypothetical protein
MTEDTSDDTAVWSAFEGAPYGVAFLDTALRTRWANRRFSALVAAPESAGGSFPLTVLQSIEGEPLSRIALAVLGGTEHSILFATPTARPRDSVASSPT